MEKIRRRKERKRTERKTEESRHRGEGGLMDGPPVKEEGLEQGRVPADVALPRVGVPATYSLNL